MFTLPYCMQGKDDPLQKRAKRPEMLKALCSNVSVKYVDAGNYADIDALWILLRDKFRFFKEIRALHTDI